MIKIVLDYFIGNDQSKKEMAAKIATAAVTILTAALGFAQMFLAATQ